MFSSMPFQAQFLQVVDTLQASRLSEPATTAPTEFAVHAVPVTVLTGFLGAGKTTVLQHVLETVSSLRIAALVNDISALAFDAALIAATTEDVMALENGCVCCSMLDDAASALCKRAGAEPAPDAIVVELSGVSEAASVAQFIDNSPALRLDGVIAVVDASTVVAMLEAPTIAEHLCRQLQSAHVVIANKTDVLDQHQLREATCAVAKVAPGRIIVPATHGVVDPAILLAGARHGISLDGGSAARPHAKVFVEGLVENLRPTSVRALELAMSALPAGVLRIKGWCAGPDGNMEVQSVGRKWTMKPHRQTAISQLALTVIAEDAVALAQARQTLKRSAAPGAVDNAPAHGFTSS